MAFRMACGGPGHTARVGHGEVDLVDRIGAGEIARYGVRDENRFIDNFRLAKGVHALAKNTDDGERNTGDGQRLPNCFIGAAELGQSKLLRDQRRMTVRQRVLLIEKAPGDQVKPAYVRVLRVHPKDQDIAFLARRRW